MDKKDLKIRALLEDLLQATNTIADLRVEVTLLTEENKDLKNTIDETQKEASDPTTI
jgi:FtsZ-binding cell division protein ZapB